MHRTAIVQQALDHLRGRTYLEIGVRGGATWRKVRARRRIGIDPRPLGRRMHAKVRTTQAKRVLRIWRGDLLFEMPSDEFFASEPNLLNRYPIDVALVDGLHTAEQSLRDVKYCLLYGAPRSLIVLHDCNPQSAVAAGSHAAARDAARNAGGWFEWNGDVYRTIIRLRATRPDLSVCVLDCDEGLGLVTEGEPDDMLDLSDEEVERITYEDLVADRERLLNLQPPAHLEDVLARL
jgi:Methyltransferase domain